MPHAEPAPPTPTALHTGSPTMRRIVGIDPGLRKTGFGVIDCQGAQLRYVASGCISTSEVASGDLPERLGLIFAGVQEIVQQHQSSWPMQACVEIVFVNVNPQSTLLLGQARGAAIAALCAARLPVLEITALQMKKAVVGHGHAAKHQVQAMVQRLLNLPGVPGPDAADALGLAISAAHSLSSFAALGTHQQRRSHALYKAGRSY